MKCSARLFAVISDSGHPSRQGYQLNLQQETAACFVVIFLLITTYFYDRSAFYGFVHLCNGTFGYSDLFNRILLPDEFQTETV